ncbi:huntingtin-like [Teleopsis dalmanni]|uniref:huntingtin-like n=1 Tax=Teleopsis dalmanni TaxID=139649 RepID=UPI0018CC7C97|nr:huntingtin-like [Teleopsis dalmanni]
MDKTNIVNTFTAYVEQLRNRECSQKEKIACFQHIADCITHPALASHHNYATHCSKATNVLLLFCEDLDSVVRMCAEENLNKIFRTLEKTRVSRILMDLYGEIKRNGNQRSLRISLNLFAHYAPQIKEKQIKWYALRLLHCMLNICQRKETQLCETLCEFVKNFGRNLQHGLTDSETCKLFEAFMANIGAECAVKRRCSSQNCISLIENSQNKSLMAKHGLSKVFELKQLHKNENDGRVHICEFIRAEVRR